MNLAIVEEYLDRIPTTRSELKVTHEVLSQFIGETVDEYHDLRDIPDEVKFTFARALQELATVIVSLESVGDIPVSKTRIQFFEDMLNELRRTLAMVEADQLRFQGAYFH